ncbi:hypothetical protein RRG08_023702 [Elysia crispata]|uniref:Uncharacterized protein n=1 Tax=Elysia crispata TaxID=231223 RepID=A0AAE0Z317_9GAST|nr:hypothetical protein RRG08_023702 [Elysia crispata]
MRVTQGAYRYIFQQAVPIEFLTRTAMLDLGAKNSKDIERIIVRCYFLFTSAKNKAKALGTLLCSNKILQVNYAVRLRRTSQEHFIDWKNLSLI